jgi:hypothetical protein
MQKLADTQWLSQRWIAGSDGLVDLNTNDAGIGAKLAQQMTGILRIL